MSSTFSLNTNVLQVNGENEYGYMNIYRTHMIFKNLNFVNLFGPALFHKYKLFLIKLIGIKNATQLILNFTATVPKIYLTMEHFNGNDIINDGDQGNYGNAVITNNSISIVSSNKANGTYSCHFTAAVGSGFLLPQFSFPASVGVTFSFWMYNTGSSHRVLFQNDEYFLATHSNGFFRFGNELISCNTPSFIYNRFEWVHVCLTYSTNNTINIFINNASVTVFNNGSVPYVTSNLGELNVGYSDNGFVMPNSPNNFEGFVDDFRFYNTILSDEERGFIYTNTYPMNGNYDDLDSSMVVNVSLSNQEERTLALCKLQADSENNLCSIPHQIFKPCEQGSLAIKLNQIHDDTITQQVLSNSEFTFEIIGIP